jgi:hypothetical protein
LQNPLAPAPLGVFGLKTFTSKTRVPRKPKASVENKPAAESAAPSANGKASADQPKKKVRAAGPTTKKKKPAAPKKTSAKQAASSGSAAAFEPTDEQIRLRAYFLAERRHRLSLPGDSNHDWIEARRQLIEESQRSAT